MFENIVNDWLIGSKKIQKKNFLLFEAHDLQNMRTRMEWSRTLQGKYFNVLGYFFSAYCIWKIFISTVNIVFDRVGKVDPITKTFDILVNWFGFDVDVTVWSQQISFIVVGIIVVTSTRGNAVAVYHVKLIVKWIGYNMLIGCALCNANSLYLCRPTLLECN